MKHVTIYGFFLLHSVSYFCFRLFVPNSLDLESSKTKIYLEKAFIKKKVIKALTFMWTVFTCLSRLHMCTISYQQNDSLFFRINYLYVCVHIVCSKLLCKILNLDEKT